MEHDALLSGVVWCVCSQSHRYFSFLSLSSGHGNLSRHLVAPPHLLTCCLVKWSLSCIVFLLSGSRDICRHLCCWVGRDREKESKAGWDELDALNWPWVRSQLSKYLSDLCWLFIAGVGTVQCSFFLDRSIRVPEVLAARTSLEDFSLKTFFSHTESAIFDILLSMSHSLVDWARKHRKKCWAPLVTCQWSNMTSVRLPFVWYLFVLL